MAGVLILGGRSDIAGEIALRLAPGNELVLAARGLHGLDERVATLRAAGATEVHTLDFDATQVEKHRDLVHAAQRCLGEGEELKTAVVAFGILGEQERAEHDEAHAFDIALVDYAAQVSMLTVLADEMKSGHIVAFSSIAGWRAPRKLCLWFHQGWSRRLLPGTGRSLARWSARANHCSPRLRHWLHDHWYEAGTVISDSRRRGRRRRGFHHGR